MAVSVFTKLSLMVVSSLNVDVAVVFLPDDKMEELNRDALRHQGPTDVISFDLRTPGCDFPKTEDDASHESSFSASSGFFL